MRGQPTGKHGRDHRFGGADPLDGDWAYALPIGPANVWSSSTAYVLGDVVSKTGGSYLCLLGHTNHAPPNTTYWKDLSTDPLSFSFAGLWGNLSDGDEPLACRLKADGDVQFKGAITGDESTANSLVATLNAFFRRGQLRRIMCSVEADGSGIGTLKFDPTTGNLTFLKEVVAATSGTAGGDLTGTYPNPTVAKINGSPLGTITSPAVADRLRWNGTAWVNSALIWRPLMALDPTTSNYAVVTAGGAAVMVEA